MKNVESLQPNKYYHVFNRAVGSEKLFLNDMDYGQFLELWKKYVIPVAEVYTYCLIPNHFHFLVRIRPLFELEKYVGIKEEVVGKSLSRQFSKCFSAYAMSFNYRNHRKGKLFMLPYKRKAVDRDDYFTLLVYYIHRNPLHHGYMENPLIWEYSSYTYLIGDHPTWIHRNEVLDWFGGIERFKEYHKFMNLLSD